MDLREAPVVDLALDAPRRRLRTKTAVPQLAALLGGEGIHQAPLQQQVEQGQEDHQGQQGPIFGQQRPDSQQHGWIGHGAELGQAQTHSPRNAEGWEVIQTHGSRSAEGQTTDTHPVADPTDNIYENLLEQHEALRSFVTQEMKLLDGGEAEQAAWLPVVAEATVCKTMVEQDLIQYQKDQEEEEQSFLVTRTVPAAEVQANLQDWKEAVVDEYKSLVEDKKAVQPVRKSELREMAPDGQLEILPGKMVYTIKAQSGKHQER